MFLPGKREKAMKKTSKTYRLSEAALEAIEGRDRLKYRTANEFVEQKILEEREAADIRQVLAELQNLKEEIGEIKSHLFREKRDLMTEKSGDYGLPNF